VKESHEFFLGEIFTVFTRSERERNSAYLNVLVFLVVFA